jgi:N-methylhydantoinase B
MDMVMMNILDSAMVAACREMGITLMKTSYSTIFNEGLDFTCALADEKGDMISVAEFCPAQIGGMPLLIKTCAQEIPFETLEEGDVIVHNDPYRGGLHTPEHTFFKPVFFKGELVGFAVSIGHVAEVGGMVPGAFAGEATEIFHEGLRVPPVKIKSRGKDVVEVWKLMLANVRTPRQNYGDYRALISSVDLGEQRMLALIEKYGLETFKRTCEDLKDYSERRMRAELSEFPDGRYSFEDTIENDGIEDKPYTLRVDVHIQGDEMVADFSRTDGQARGAINATLGVTWSATYNAILHLTDPSIPKNSGAFRPIRIVAPPGRVVNVDYPAPEVGGNTESHPRIAYLVAGALAACVPERSFCTDGSTATNLVFGGYDPDYDEYFACYDIMSTGWGGTHDHDGNDCVLQINGNCRINPTEVFETRFPWHVEDMRMVDDSGGAGRWRGGLGLEKTMLVRKTEITSSQMSDHHRVPPWGLFGGHPGALAGVWVRPAGTGEWRTVKEAYGKVSSSKYANIVFRPGDKVRLRTPGGGGWGHPRERDAGALAEDVREGYVSAAKARETYGYEAS